MTYISTLLTQTKKIKIGTHLRGRDFNKKNKNRTSILSLTTTTKTTTTTTTSNNIVIYILAKI